MASDSALHSSALLSPFVRVLTGCLCMALQLDQCSVQMTVLRELLDEKHASIVDDERERRVRGYMQAVRNEQPLGKKEIVKRTALVWHDPANIKAKAGNNLGKVFNDYLHVCLPHRFLRATPWPTLPIFFFFCCHCNLIACVSARNCVRRQ